MSGSDPSPDSQGPGRAGFWAFWTTLPGILTGSAALLTAIVGLMTLLRGSSGERSEVEVESASPPAGMSTPGDGAGAASPASAIFAEGRLTMRSPDSADLETGLVGTSPPGYDLYLHCSGVECILNAMSSLMTVADDARDRSACVDALRARRDQALYLQELHVGQILCVQTADGHVGSLEILALPGVGSIAFDFSYTLWR
jgi:hypothetical protein